MTAKEFTERIDTVFRIVSFSIIAKNRLNNILLNEELFYKNYPDLTFSNHTILHAIEQEVILETTKQEIVSKFNDDLYIAWQILFCFAGMSSILEYYLKLKAEEISGHKCRAQSIFNKFNEITGINLSEFTQYKEVVKFYQVRHISLHNLGLVDQKFVDLVGSDQAINTPYIYYPIDTRNYRDALVELSNFIEEKITNK